MNNIVLQKDGVVQGLQDQVVAFLSHDYHAMQVLWEVLLIIKLLLMQGLY